MPLIPPNTGWEIPWPWSICRSDYAPNSNLPYSVSKLRIVDNDLLARTLWVSVVRYDATGLHEDSPPQAISFLAGNQDKVFDVDLNTVNAPGERWLRIYRDSLVNTGKLVAVGLYNEINGNDPYQYTTWLQLSAGRPFSILDDTGCPPLD